MAIPFNLPEHLQNPSELNRAQFTRIEILLNQIMIMLRDNGSFLGSGSALFTIPENANLDDYYAAVAAARRELDRSAAAHRNAYIALALHVNNAANNATAYNAAANNAAANNVAANNAAANNSAANNAAANNSAANNAAANNEAANNAAANNAGANYATSNNVTANNAANNNASTNSDFFDILADSAPAYVHYPLPRQHTNVEQQQHFQTQHAGQTDMISSCVTSLANDKVPKTIVLKLELYTPCCFNHGAMLKVIGVTKMLGTTNFVSGREQALNNTIRSARFPYIYAQELVEERSNWPFMSLLNRSTFDTAIITAAVVVVGYKIFFNH